MDAVSLETSNENEWIKKRMVDEKVSQHTVLLGSIHLSPSAWSQEGGKNLNQYFGIIIF